MAKKSEGYRNVTLRNGAYEAVLKHVREVDKRLAANTIHDAKELAAFYTTPAIQLLEEAGKA